MSPDRIAKAAVVALDEIKGRDIRVFDVRHMTAMFDKVIIASGDSVRQNKALADNIQVKLKALGASVQGVEGADSGEWVLVDLGSVIVHIMQPAIRQHYNLEELWGEKPVATRRGTTARARRAG